jgi:ABC-type Fe3+-siderophore transport system permease subunit
MNTFKGELSVGVGLLALLYIIFNPWNLFMPGYVVMGFLIAAIVLYIAFATFLWKENEGDEREQFHRLFADRIAYLVGSAVLLIGIVLGELQHALNPWLILALAAMVLAKVVGLMYGKNKL